MCVSDCALVWVWKERVRPKVHKTLEPLGDAPCWVLVGVRSEEKIETGESKIAKPNRPFPFRFSRQSYGWWTSDDSHNEGNPGTECERIKVSRY